MTIKDCITMPRLIVTVILVLCFLSPSYTQDIQPFDVQHMVELFKAKLPVDNRSTDEPEDFEELYDDLQIAEIYTINDLTDLIDTHLEKVLELEKDICIQITENKDSDLTATVSTGTYGADFEDLERIKGGIFFSPVGLVRTMIELQHPSDPNDTSDE